MRQCLPSVRRTIGIVVAALIVTVGASPAVAAPARYSFVDLGTLGGESSYASAINDRGHVVGSSQVADGSWHGFVWRAGRMTDLGLLRPTDINNKGDIIGTTDESAFLLKAGKLIDLGPGVFPTALNDRGQVVGTSSAPFLWSAGTMRTLPLDTVSDINNRGQISGGRLVPGGFHAAVLRRSQITDLGAGPFNRSNTAGINDRGWVIGWQFSTTQAERGILWRGGTATDVGTLGGDATHLTAINDRGVILGTSRLPNGTVHPIRWRNGTLTDLTTLGVDPDHDLIDINDHGQIAASYRPVFGIAHAALYR
jgi:probable HAF family extracellular repeat protein